MISTSHTAIHRKLVFRISLVGFLIALTAGFAVWQFEKEKIDQWILIKTESGFKRLNNSIRHLLNDPGNLNRLEMEKHAATILAQRDFMVTGRYVWIGIYDLKGTTVAQVPDISYEHIEQVETITGSIQPDADRRGNMGISVIKLNQIPHVQIVAPLSNERGELAAYGETIFAIAPKAIAAVETRALRLAAAAMVIVLLTTALLYPVINSLLSRVSRLSAKLFDANLAVLTVLGSAIAKRDSDTDAHNYRVTIISVKLAEELCLAADTIQRLIKGAFLHDVGKIGIEDGILHKPGRLTNEEFAVMQGHVPLGLDIVNKAEWIKEGMDIVAYHHEKYDGRGYNRGLAGKQIPEIARIFAIADVFDALTSHRPYKEPFSFEKTMDILQDGRGGHFDPDYIDAFASISRTLYDTYAGREDEALKSELDAIIKKYFYA